jgi:hypothetical protein
MHGHMKLEYCFIYIFSIEIVRGTKQLTALKLQILLIGSYLLMQPRTPPYCKEPKVSIPFPHTLVTDLCLHISYCLNHLNYFPQLSLIIRPKLPSPPQSHTPFLSYRYFDHNFIGSSLSLHLYCMAYPLNFPRFNCLVYLNESKSYEVSLMQFSPSLVIFSFLG